MAKKKSFTVEQLQEFRRLREELADTERRKREIVEKADRIKAQLDAEFRDLEQHPEIFSSGNEIAIPDAELQLEDTHYVTQDKKRILIRKILSDYRRLNPDAETIPYKVVKIILERDYGIETKSIANFFLGLLSDYETVGGNRNKAIVLPED